MKRIPVNSSNIRAIGYDPEALVLEIEFVNGQIYEYANVPQGVYDEFMAAKSRGAFAYRRIFPHFKVLSKT